jgi:hypothetical protein
VRKEKISSSYEKLMRASLWGWFTSRGDIKPNYIHAQLGFAIKKTKYNMLVLEKYSKLRANTWLRCSRK